MMGFYIYNKTKAKPKRRYYVLRNERGTVDHIVSHEWIKVDEFDLSWSVLSYNAEEITKTEFETYQEFGISKISTWRITEEYIWFPRLVFHCALVWAKRKAKLPTWTWPF